MKRKIVSLLKQLCDTWTAEYMNRHYNDHLLKRRALLFQIAILRFKIEQLNNGGYASRPYKFFRD